MQTCPKCKQLIDDDSWFCDQCGTELMVCPKCKTIKRGIRCNACGTKLVSAKEFSSVAGMLGGCTTPPFGKVNTPTGAVQVQTQAQDVGMQVPNGGMQTSGFPSSSGNIQQQPTGTDITLRPGMQQPQPSGASLPRPDHLVCKSPSLRLGVGNGAVIGRRGDYAQVFAGHGFVSGLHARLQFNTRGELELVDLGSTNGTFVNGVMLSPNVPKVICIGDSISFAGMEFKAEA